MPAKKEFKSEIRFQIGDWFVVEKLETGWKVIGAGDSIENAESGLVITQKDWCDASSISFEEFIHNASTGNYWTGKVDTEAKALLLHNVVEKSLAE